MRVAANEVERVLALAQSEVRQETSDVPRQTRLEELSAAFRLASDLRDRPFGLRRVCGRKSRRYQTVRTTHFTKTVGDDEYVLCLVPYTPAQEAGRRHTTPRFLYRKGDKIVGEIAARGSPPGTVTLDARMPVFAHEQWIRRDRLEAV